MKIAIVCPYRMDRPGGVQNHVQALAIVLRNAGEQVEMIVPGIDDVAEKPGIHPFGKAFPLRINQAVSDFSLAWGNEWRRLRTYLTEERFDLIHFHTIWEPFLPLQILWASPESAYVATFHETPPNTWFGAGLRTTYRGLSRLLYSRMHAITAVSPSAAAYLYRRSDRPIHIIPPCIDLSPYLDHVVEPLPSEKVRILFLSRMDPRKGVDLLLQAYRLLIDEGCPVSLTLAGEGVMAPQAQRLIHEWGLPHVTWVGAVPEVDKPALYQQCDIFCAPAPHGESFGLVLVEAMASGRAVVAAANPGYREVLQQQERFCLCTPGSVEELRDQLRGLVIDSGKRQQLGQWGLKEAAQYDCREYLTAFQAVYREALARQRTT